ncbi:hypothetical protein OH77DRAFT_1405030, partial [Trametes cingulata]
MDRSDFDIVGWFRGALSEVLPSRLGPVRGDTSGRVGDLFSELCSQTLNDWIPWPSGFDEPDALDLLRFSVFQYGDTLLIEDQYLAVSCDLPISLYTLPCFDLVGWYGRVVRRRMNGDAAFGIEELEGELASLFHDTECEGHTFHGLALHAARPHLPESEPVQRNALAPRDFRRVVPEPIVVVVHVNCHPARALLDSGSLADFMSARLAQQLAIKLLELEKPLPVQLAVQGSRAKINYGCKARFEYQNINEERYFDIMNLLSYDLILGTPFLSQHQMLLGFNPSKVVVGRALSGTVDRSQKRVVESRAADIFEARLDKARAALQDYAAPICRDASDAPFPPLRAINHTIPLKDPSRVYSWRPSKCPDALRHLWIEKRDAYLKSGRWKMTSARNTSPMLLLTKPGTG